jgi:hypothetical protein
LEALTMRELLVLVILLAVSLPYGCSSDEWTHRYKKKEELVYDYNSCERQMEVQQNSGARSAVISPYVMKTMIDQCLQKNGWIKGSKQ